MSRRTNCKQISKFFYQTEDVWKYLMQMIFKWKSPKLSPFVSFTLCTISPLAALVKITFTHKQILQKRIFKSIITIHYGSCYSRISIHYRMHVLWLRVWNSIVCLKDFSYCYWQNLENCLCMKYLTLPEIIFIFDPRRKHPNTSDITPTFTRLYTLFFFL